MTDDTIRPLRTTRLPLSAQAQQYLLRLIDEGVYRPGDRLPSEMELALQLGISRLTLREALLNLEQAAVVVRKHGVGTFVSPGVEQRLDAGLERLESVLEQASRQGLDVRFHDLSVEVEPADQELAAKLRVTAGTPLTSVSRVISVRRRPAAFMLDLAPLSLLSPQDVDGTFNGSVLELLRKKLDLRQATAVANIAALNVDDLLADKLQVQPGQALVLLEETLFDAGGQAVGFSRNYFVPEFFRFHVLRR